MRNQEGKQAATAMTKMLSLEQAGDSAVRLNRDTPYTPFQRTWKTTESYQNALLNRIITLFTVIK